MMVSSLGELDDSMPERADADPMKPDVSTRKQPHLDLNGNTFEVPTFTMKDIRAAIPPHCFKSSAIHSLLYVLRDCTYIALLGGLSLTTIPHLGTPILRLLAWALSTFLLSLPGTGLWILAHECGHGSFSPSKKLNHTVGLILHSILLVPFHSWRISHSQHHKSTGNLAKDTVFVPHTRPSWIRARFGPEADYRAHQFQELSEDAPIVNLWNCLVHQSIGWPGYLAANLTGQAYTEKGARGWWAKTHFWAGESSVFFKKEERGQILLSDAGILALFLCLAGWGYKYGVWYPMVLWGVPWLWINSWIVAITFLQHTDPTLPHYSPSTWTFALGATSTIDRDLGFIDSHFFHSIIGTHVCHHLVSTIPFYHAAEATIHIRKVMGTHYREDRETGFWKAFWRNQAGCKFVEESKGRQGEGVWMFRNLWNRHGETAAKRLGSVDVGEQREKVSVPRVNQSGVGVHATLVSGTKAKMDVSGRRLSSTAQLKAALPLLAEG